MMCNCTLCFIWSAEELIGSNPLKFWGSLMNISLKGSDTLSHFNFVHFQFLQKKKFRGFFVVPCDSKKMKTIFLNIEKNIMCVRISLNKNLFERRLFWTHPLYIYIKQQSLFSCQSVCLSVCLFKCLINSGTPKPICLKFWLGTSVKPCGCSLLVKIFWLKYFKLNELNFIGKPPSKAGFPS